MTYERLFDEVVSDNGRDLEGWGGGRTSPGVKSAAVHRGGTHLPGVLTAVLAVAALSVLVGVTASLGGPEVAEVAVSEVEADEPVRVLMVPPGAIPAGSSSLRIGSSTPTIDAPWPAPPAPLEEGFEVSRLLEPVRPSAEWPGLQGASALSTGQSQPQQPQFLHVDVDGDSAVIISSPDVDAAWSPVAQRGEDNPAVPPPSKGEMFTWHDGDRQAIVWQDTRLAVADVIPEGGWGDPSGPVFWSESYGLMALPGGVVLVLDPAWDAAAIEAFMASNGIDPSEAEVLGGLVNFFKLETDPGFPSLRLANSLAGKSGVIISSPNWWIGDLVK